MPYIAKKDRPKYNKVLSQIPLMEKKGSLEYCIFYLMLKYMLDKERNYDQVIIIARKVNRNEHVTTYGKDKPNCDVAARIGNFLKYKVMKWPQEEPEEKKEWKIFEEPCGFEAKIGTSIYQNIKTKEFYTYCTECHDSQCMVRVV